VLNSRRPRQHQLPDEISSLFLVSNVGKHYLVSRRSEKPKLHNVHIRSATRKNVITLLDSMLGLPFSLIEDANGWHQVRANDRIVISPSFARDWY